MQYLGLIVFLILIFLFFKYQNKNKVSEIQWIDKFKKELEKYKYLIFKKDYVTTYSEWQFFRRLVQYTENKDVLIFTKVRVEDIIWIKATNKGFRPYSISGRLDRSHVDFVCVQKSTLKIICAIELDDPSHISDYAKEHDAVKNFIFDFVKIPLIRFTSISPTDEEFRAKWL